MKRFRIALLFLAVGLALGQAGNVSAAWQYYRAVTIDHTKVGATDSTNFSMLVSGTYAYLKTTGNGGFVTSSSGYDVGFFSDAKLTTALSFKLYTNSYSASTGAIICRVLVPTVSHTTDTVIYMAYDNPSITTDQSSSSAWRSAYKGVWALEDGTTLSALDSTSNANNGTVTGATATTGEVGGAASFSGSSQYVSVGNGASLQGLTGDLTIMAWVHPTDFTGYRSLLSKVAATTANPGPFDSYIAQTTGKLVILQGNAGGGLLDQWMSTSAISSGVWTHVVLQIKNSGGGSRAAFFYINGTADTAVNTSSATFSPADSGQNAYIGSRTTLDIFFKGPMDEVAVLNSIISADEVTAVYNNESSPSTFYTVGSQQAAGTSGFFFLVR